MTPAVNAARKANIHFALHEYEHDPTAASYGLEAAEKLHLIPERVFKTLVVSSDAKGLAVAIIPVSRQLNLKAVAAALAVKKCQMADPRDVERSTGYVLGGVSPLGQKRRLPSLIDQSALNHQTVFVSAGRRGLEIELAATDLAVLLDAAVVPLVG